MNIVFSYDIADSKRRERLRKTLLRFGIPVQFSVFECDLTPRQLEQIKRAVRTVIKEREDNIRCYLICGNCAKSVDVFGGRPLTEVKDVYII
jgi:CRISPR-associated protein Cas2